MDEGGIAWSIVEWRCIRSSIEFSNEAPHEEAKSEAPHEEANSEAPHEEAVQSLKEATGALSVGMVKKKKKKKKRRILTANFSSIRNIFGLTSGKDRCSKAGKSRAWALSFCVRQSSTFVTSWTRRECLAQMYNTSWVAHFCFLLVEQNSLPSKLALNPTSSNSILTSSRFSPAWILNSLSFALHHCLLSLSLKLVFTAYPFKPP